MVSFARKETQVKRVVIAVALSLLVVVALAANVSAADNESKARVLTGQVTDRNDAPVPDAIVYLKNTKTLGVKTYITDSAGGYRFPELSPNIDYEVYAEHKGAKSDTKTLSSFDSRQKPVMNLKIGK